MNSPMILSRSWTLLPAMLILTGTFALYADEVTLDNGQKMLGRVSKLDDLDLYWSVHFADSSIPIRWKNVTELVTTAPIRIELRDGRAFFGNLKMTADGSVLIFSEKGDVPPVKTTRDELFVLEERKGVLDGELGISGTGSTGNLDTASVRLYWDFIFKWEATDLQIKGDANFDSTDNVSTNRSIYAQIRYDWRFGDPAFLFSSLEETHDHFNDVQSRTVTTVGVGTYLYNVPRFILRADLGATYTVSRLQIGEDSETPGFRPSISLRVKLPFDLRLKDSVTFYGNLKNSEDWQARNELMVSREVFKGFHLNGGLTSTWDHGAAPGVPRRDDTYYFGLGYEF